MTKIVSNSSTFYSAICAAVRGIGYCALLLAVQQFVVVPRAFGWDLVDGDWYGPTVKDDSNNGGAYSPISSGSGAFAGTQNVFFDFDSAFTAGEHTYTLAQRNTIVAGVAAIYAPWDLTFSHTVVPAGAHARLIFNDGPAGGLASDVEFRNLDLGGSATINVCGILGGCPAAVPASVVGLSTTIGAHELGHLLGLRHADSLGPIGSGLAPSGPPAGGYFPAYVGPGAAVETTKHTMASPASVGQTVAEAIAGSFMGERSAVKLEFNEVGTVSPEVLVAHSTPATAQLLTLPTFSVPNTAVAGNLRFGMNLFADAEVVTASISASGQVDYYKFTGAPGEIINVEAISLVPNRFGAGDVDSTITIYGPDGVTLVPGGHSSNDDEFESFDSALIDVVLPVAGTYYVKIGVSPFVPTDTGAYELYLYRFRAVAVPEPTALALLAFGTLIAAGSLRQRGLSKL